MGINTKAIKRRIKSVGSTKKITKAMEMISAVKMRRAVANVLATRSYAALAWQMLTDVAKKTNINLHPLLEKRPVKKAAVALIVSNRGLAGGFNSRILMETDAIIKKLKNQGVEVEVFVNGKRGKKIYQQFGHTITAEFDKMDLTMKVEEVAPMSNMIVHDYTAQKYDEIYLGYTDYISAIKHIPKIKKLLPLSATADDTLGAVGEPEDREVVASAEFLFEPNPANVLNVLLPRLVEVQIYQAVLESDASEHSARMMAMRNASDAAEDMIKELNYNFNKARQSAITQEISEIVGGAAAL
ncbi:MAG: ATP synthase F1 subunit gamma [Candidatus Magasanikbacteria bacterium]|nr:ATP synthase F1 subunit gamma [Candidatus Magasanikbacteria bacterium]